MQGSRNQGDRDVPVPDDPVDTNTRDGPTPVNQLDPSLQPAFSRCLPPQEQSIANETTPIQLLHLIEHLRHNLEEAAHQRQYRHLEDPGLLVLADRHDDGLYLGFPGYLPFLIEDDLVQ